jgi:glycosyltransferase involved in cell wall biosynthesis
MIDKPIQITKQNWSSGTVPVLSVFNWVYNHKDFIRESIESILIQKTNFPVEIIIPDDASNDGTKEIILEYQEKHPQLFRNIIQDENQWSQGKSVMTPLFEMPKGKYIALTHGDDYWTDPLKLQKQVDFLEENKECSYIFTNNLTLNKDGSFNNSSYEFNKVFDLNFLLHQHIMPATASVIFRKTELAKLDKWHSVFEIGFHGDWILLFMVTFESKIGFLSDITAVYRKDVGIISNSNNAVKFKNAMRVNKIINKLTQFKFNSILGNTEYYYRNISLAFFSNNEPIKGILWMIRLELFLILSFKFKHFRSKENLNYLKHCIKSLLPISYS